MTATSSFLNLPPRSEAEAKREIKSEWLRQKMDPAAQRAEKIALLEETARVLRKQARVGGTNLDLRADAVEWAIEELRHPVAAAAE